MKTVRLRNNTVAEIIPEYALPVETWYGEAFAAQCMKAPDEVERRWTYDPESGTWSEPGDTDPAPEPTVWDELAAAITEGVNAV